MLTDHMADDVTGDVIVLHSQGSLQKYLISRGRSVITPMELLSFAR